MYDIGAIEEVNEHPFSNTMLMVGWFDSRLVQELVALGISFTFFTPASEYTNAKIKNY